MNNNIEKYITVSNLSVAYEGNIVIQNANFEIFSNDFIGIIGPNGGGKTTLVKALLKSIEYTGKIEYMPSLMNANNHKIGYLPQINSLDRSFPISTTEVVLSGLQSNKRLWGRYDKQDRQKAMSLMESTGIISLSRRTVGDLSGGEFQRVLLCRALISDPKLLILDEPNNYVDNKFEKELYELLKHLNEKMAIIMVSHDLGTITSYIKSIMCVNRTVHLHKSNLITPEQLLSYECPIQLVHHGEIPHTVVALH